MVERKVANPPAVLALVNKTGGKRRMAASRRTRSREDLLDQIDNLKQDLADAEEENEILAERLNRTISVASGDEEEQEEADEEEEEE